MPLIYPVNYTPLDIDGYLGQITVPEVIKCDQTSPTEAKPLDELWCKVRCVQQDGNYHPPVPRNEKFMLQLSVFDKTSTDNTVPDSGWGTLATAELCDQDGTVVSTDCTEFLSRANNSYKDRNYQTVEVDTSLPVFAPLQGFQIKFTVGTTELYTEVYQLIDIDKISLIKVESNYTRDCLGRFYDTPDALVGDSFVYSNKKWFYGSIQRSNIAFTKTFFDEGTIAEEVVFTDTFRLSLSKKVPPYVAKDLITILGGDNVKVNDIEYISEEVTIDDKVAFGSGKMHLFSVLLTQECVINGGC